MIRLSTLGLCFLLTILVIGCGTEPKPFPPPEGYSSWEEYKKSWEQPEASAEVKEQFKELIIESSKDWFIQPPERVPVIEVKHPPRLLKYIDSEPSFDAENPRYIIHEDGTIEVGADYEPIELINNPEARDITYEELIAFIKEDPTDTNDYLEDEYICSDFAEDVHNNAESAGIRAAWVGIDFYDDSDGHALNAFDTIDKGLVYIDCTNVDAIAYVVITEKYGCIEIDKATSLDYSFYKTYEWRYEAIDEAMIEYNEEVLSFNQKSEGYAEMLTEYNERVTDYNEKYTLYCMEYEYYLKLLELQSLLKLKPDDIRRQLAEMELRLLRRSTRTEVTQEYLEEKEVALKDLEKEIKEEETKLKSVKWDLKKWKSRLDTMSYKINDLKESFDVGDYWLEPLGIVKNISIHWGNS